MPRVTSQPSLQVLQVGEEQCQRNVSGAESVQIHGLEQDGGYAVITVFMSGEQRYRLHDSGTDCNALYPLHEDALARWPVSRSIRISRPCLDYQLQLEACL